MSSVILPTAEYIRDLPVDSEHADYIVKIANARDLIANLPAPANVNRDLSLVPPVNIIFTLSTSPELPAHVLKKIVAPGDKTIFGNKGMLGLCTSGRGMPVKIFLHEHFLTASDPSGELLEEVAFHETIHGIEGIEQKSDGSLKRHSPWSYELQQQMLEIDEKNGHIPDFHQDLFVKAYTKYLRSGTGLQQNVSELFARVAVVNMYQIKETGQALNSFSEFFRMALKLNLSDKITRKEYNLIDFMGARGTFSEEAQTKLFEEGDNMIRRIAQLYGYEMH